MITGITTTITAMRMGIPMAIRTAILMGTTIIITGMVTTMPMGITCIPI